MPPLRYAVAAAALLAACGRAPAPGTPAPSAAPAAAASRDTALAAAAATAAAERLPEVPPARGPLRIQVVYPAPDAVVDAADSSFVFGSVGTGEAALTINGQPVRVAPNGAWLAWVALPRDSLLRFELVARTPTDSARTVLTARRAPRFTPPAGRTAWVDTTSLSPRGRAWLPAGEWLPLRLRATPGAEVRLRLADGSVIRFASDSGPEEVPEGIRAFDRDTANLRRPIRTDRYAGAIRGRAVGADPGPVLPGAPSATAPLLALRCAAGVVCAIPAFGDTASPTVEVIVGGDTARAAWPLQIALLDTLPLGVELDDDSAGRGDTDSLTIGRALPGGTYTWFFPTGTRATVAARVNDNLRLRLSDAASAWVPAADAWPLPAGLPAPSAIVGSVTLTPRADRVVVRVPLSGRVPFQVSESDRRLVLHVYGAAGDVNWIRYGPTDSLVRDVRWVQATADEVTLTFDLAEPVWGWRARWDRTDVVLEIRRPPVIDGGSPLRGRLVFVDPGHPPLGATGPTGLREADANLAVALRLRELLEGAGARVVMTRTRDSSVDLLPRTRLAEALDADLLVSVHNNALPDGVNPFPNNGTSVFYNHPRALPLAREIQRALVERLGLRDLGVGRGDLALVRPTWMPAVLTEGLFMMVPEQEAALRHPEGQRLYAQGIFEGIRRFLRDRAEMRERN